MLFFEGRTSLEGEWGKINWRKPSENGLMSVIGPWITFGGLEQSARVNNGICDSVDEDRVQMANGGIGSGGVVARRGVIVVWSIETFRSGIKQVARLLCFSWARSVELESITDEMNGPARGALFWNS